MWFLIFFVIFLILFFIFFQERLNKKHRLIFKMIASFAFLTLAINRFFIISDKNITSLLLLMGLLFGVLGDLFLGFNHLKDLIIFLILGSVSFLLGHFCYLFSFLKYANIKGYIPFILAFGILIIYHFHFQKNKFHIGKFKIPFYLYLFTLTYLTTFAIFNLLFLILFQTIGNNKVVLYPIGFFLFLVSDLFLSAIYFKKLSHRQFKYYRFSSTLFYYSAQLLIAFMV